MDNIGTKVNIGFCKSIGLKNQHFPVKKRLNFKIIFYFNNQIIYRNDVISFIRINFKDLYLNHHFTIDKSFYSKK